MISLSRFPKSLLAVVLCAGLLGPGGNFGLALAANTAPGAPATPAAPAPVVSAVPTSFDEVAARLDRGGSFYLYLSASQWFDQLSGHVTEWRDLLLKSLPKDQKDDADRQKIEQAFNIVAKLVQESGVEQITGFGASSLALSPGVNRNVVFVHHYKGKENGLLGTAFGTAPHPLTALDLLPPDTALASYGDLDLARILGTLRDVLEQSGIPEVKSAVDQGLAQFNAVAGMPLDSLLQSLGGADGIVLTLDPTKQIEVPLGDGRKQKFPLPRLALLLQMNDDRIFQRLDPMLGMVPNLIRVDEPGLRMRTMAFPALPDFTVRATVAQWDKVLVITSDDGLIRDMIAAQKTGQGLKAAPEFVKLAAGMPTEGNGFTLVTRSFGEAYKTAQTEMLNKGSGVPPEQKELFGKLAAMQDASASYSVRAHVDNGWLSVSKGSKGIEQVLLPLAIVPVGIAAGIALPVFNSVQVKGKATKSLAQEKQIVLACQLYATDHKGKFPPSLDALLPKYLNSKTVLVSPFAPSEPLGYTYTPGLTTKSPVNTVVIEDKYSTGEHQRVVAHLDGSAEATKAP